MPAPDPWHSRVRAAVARFWKSEDSRISAVRDLVVAAGIVLLLLGGIWVYTGQGLSNAPLVVVESGSMMHGPTGPCLRNVDCFDTPIFGRVGTIDPGDLVLVKDIDEWDDLETAFGAGGRGGYGAHGDVVVYKDPNRPDPTPVIHRAMLLVQVESEGCIPNGSQNPCRYVIPETCDAEGFAEFVQARAGSSDWRAYCQGSSEPITLDLKRGGVYLSLNNYPCTQTCPAFYSGLITKGDNNQLPDQPAPYPGRSPTSGITCCPVALEWVVGKARGEIPWFGLIKLAIYGNERYGCGPGESCNDPTDRPQWTLFLATAPYDIWIGLFVAIGILVMLPIGFDHGMAFIRRKIEEGRGGSGPPPPPPPP